VIAPSGSNKSGASTLLKSAAKAVFEVLVEREVAAGITSANNDRQLIVKEITAEKRLLVLMKNKGNKIVNDYLLSLILS
jgi:hypothetical protein